MLWIGFVAAIGFQGDPSPAGDAGPRLVARVVDGRAEIAVVGLPAKEVAALTERYLSPDDWTRVFPVKVADGSAESPTVLGDHECRAGSILFRPRFGLDPQKGYIATFRRSRTVAHPVLTLTIEAQAAPASTARVVRILPDGDVLPENLLRLYIQFSAPMSRGVAYDYLELAEIDGEPIEHAFLELEQELWDPSQERLTILFDPGRIKRGLIPNEEVGSPLREGKSYVFRVKPGFPDADGRPTGDGLTIRFKVGPPDRQSPRPSDWRIRPPAADSRHPVVLDTLEPLDHALLGRLVRVVDASDREVAGTVRVERGEKEWTFTPQHPWSAGRYRVRVQNTLEDLAGNNVARPFEVDTVPQDPVFEEGFTDLPFEVGVRTSR